MYQPLLNVIWNNVVQGHKHWTMKGQQWFFYLSAQQIPSAVNSALFNKYALYTGSALNNPHLLLIWNENEKNVSLKEGGIRKLWKSLEPH